MKFSAKVNIPHKLLDSGRLLRAVENALTDQAVEAQVQFETTTETWSEQNQPKFFISRDTLSRQVWTENANYIRLNEGTRPHKIIAKPGGVLAFPKSYRPKTRVRVIGSGKGFKSRELVYTTEVNHPGTEARKWDGVIASKLRKNLPKVIARAIQYEIMRQV
jgi:hypothetical protein